MNSSVSAFLGFLIMLAFGFYIASCIPELGFSKGSRNKSVVIKIDSKSGKTFKVRIPENTEITESLIDRLRRQIDAGIEPVEAEPLSLPIATSSREQRPQCREWHRVVSGDTQWSLANRYAPHSDKWRWIKSMRWVSRKSAGDEDLKAGESVCVKWVKQ